MANNPEHVEIVRRGCLAIAEWRGANQTGVLNLENADLRGLDLRQVDFHGANLRSARLQRTYFTHADLRGAQLSKANLYRSVLDFACLAYAGLEEAQLQHADLIGADMREASMSRANLRSTILNQTILSGADLQETDLRGSGLWGANLTKANLRGADLRGATLGDATSLTDADLSSADLRDATLLTTSLCRTNLSSADLTGATFFGVICADLDLSNVIGLETVKHVGPSTLGLDTLERSRGEIPISFLRGCGLSDWQLAAVKLHAPDLTDEVADSLIYELRRLRVGSAIQITRLFISYSRSDSEFVDTIEPMLRARGIRFWRDVHDLTSGRIEAQLTKAITLNPRVLLVLSENSVKSDWVEWEAATARELEKKLRRDVLCPISLDNAWRVCAWPGPLRRQIEDYHVLDFSGWRDASYLNAQFVKLITGLEIFYRDATSPG